MDELEKYRKQVDRVDALIMKALSERTRICVAIGEVKKKRGIPVRDISREKEVYKSVKEKSVKFGLDPVQVEAVYREIVNMCSAVQERKAPATES
ncbi:MAG TPA: chorismate mutase [Candidatus Limnocylindrales bacterium]|nr:chorismate mutase [Candidatus Limnocylindrales bacterium]